MTVYSFYDLANDISNSSEIDFEVVKRMVSKKLDEDDQASISCKSDSKYILNSVSLAIKHSNISLLEILSPLISKKQGHSVLKMATKKGNIDILKYVLDLLPNQSIKSSLLIANSNHLRPDISMFLLDYANKNEDYSHSFYSACSYSSHEVIEKMLKLDLVDFDTIFSSLKITLDYSNNYYPLKESKKKIVSLLINYCSLSDLQSQQFKEYMDKLSLSPKVSKKLLLHTSSVISHRILKENLQLPSQEKYKKPRIKII